VSKANNGDPGNLVSERASISAGGRFVAFHSKATNLPGGDGLDDYVYVRDLEEGRTILASKTGGGDPAYGELFGQSISSNGRFVVFMSSDPDLPAGDGSLSHVYLRDLDRNRTILVDRHPDGEVSDGDSGFPSISGTGRYVAFDSYTPGGNKERVYLRDLVERRTRLVSRNNAGQIADPYAYYAHVSRDGRYVAFLGEADNLPGGGPFTQVYVRDMAQETTRLLSRTANGDPADGDTSQPSISLDGGFVAFYTDADNLGGNDDYSDAFRAGPIG
jgi:Tol biopolymer transport system component